MKLFSKAFLLGFLLFSHTGFASVVPEYANNIYTEHSLSRSEKKCIDEGYKITYANCSNMTAPADRCPYHDSYYRSCSQEQWCRNNNYTFLEDDCKLPTYPIKMCDNKYPMYRACQENLVKACEEAGFTSQLKCQLTEKRCPYTPDFGKCCDNCPDFSHEVDNIPAGYIARGETCTTCDGIVKTNVEEAPCDGYMSCQFGPLSPQTPSCLQGKRTLYTACKTAEMLCKEKGYLYSSCQTSEDAENCPENENLKKCTVNCYKLAVEMYPESDIIGANTVDPVIDVTKKNLRSLFGHISNACISKNRPEVTLNINEKTLEMYSNIFDRTIENVNFVLNFETPASLPANGSLNNVRIKVTGNAPDCPLKGKVLTVRGTVSLVDMVNICADINIEDSSKFITTGNVTGEVSVGKDSSLGLKGNLVGSLKTKSYAEIFIKGILKASDKSNHSAEDAKIIFGCNSKAKINGGIIAYTTNVLLKQRCFLDTPYIKLTSTGNNPDMPATLSGIHMHKYSKIISVLDSTEYPMVDNNDLNCDDKYAIHLGSSINKEEQTTSLEPSNLLEDLWQCRSLVKQQMDCD